MLFQFGWTTSASIEVRKGILFLATGDEKGLADTGPKQVVAHWWVARSAQGAN